MKKLFTKIEWSWIMYDWANSVYATNIMAAIFPIYFTSVLGENTLGIQWWGIGTSFATLIVALLGPVLGAVADCKGMKKKFWGFFAIMGITFTLLMAISDVWQGMLIGYVISYIGFQGSCLYYDSFLTDVTTPKKMDTVSSWGFAMGYIGGSTIAFVISIIIMMILGMENPLGVKIAVVITSLWWALFSIPMLLNVKQVHYKEDKPIAVVKNTFSNLRKTLKSISKNRGLFLFMIAYFFYIDGVGTIITMSTSYGTTLGIGTVGMILALLVTQLIGVPSSILFGKFAKKLGAFKMIGGAIAIYFCITIVGFYMGYIVESNPGDPAALQTATILFWTMACMVGTVQGGIQSLSRAQFGKMVPAENSNEYFGFFDIFGKFASVIGPFLVAQITMFTGKSSLGVLSLIILFLIGGIIFVYGHKDMAKSVDLANKSR